MQNTKRLIAYCEDLAKDDTVDLIPAARTELLALCSKANAEVQDGVKPVAGPRHLVY